MDASEVGRVIAETAKAWLNLPARRLARCDVREDAAIWLGLTAESDCLSEEGWEDLRADARKLSYRWSIDWQLELIERAEQERLVATRLSRSDLPDDPELSIVIRRRLARAGYWLKRLRAAGEIADVHGIGPKAIEQLRPIAGWTSG
jgi:hypothetical protein